MIAARTGSSVATTAARLAGTWRRAVTMHTKGSAVPTITTPRPSAMFSALANFSKGKVQIGWTTSQNRVAKPKPHTSVVTAS